MSVPQSKKAICEMFVRLHCKIPAGVFRCVCAADTGVETEDFGLQPHEVDEEDLTTYIVYGKQL